MTAYELNCMTINIAFQSSLLILVLDWNLPHICLICQFLMTIPFIQVERGASKVLMMSRTCYILLRIQTFAKDCQKSNSVVTDPTWDDKVTEFSQSTVLCHSVPKLLCESHYKTSVTFRSPNCIVLDCTTPATTEKEQCKPCSKAHKLSKKAATRKMTVSSVPAKSKASLSSCGPDKLRATVKATRLECKQLEDRVKELETRINEDGVSISETLEKDILKIMGGQNLEATPHMKFFWQQQMKLLQIEKMAQKISPPNYTLCIVPSW